MDANKGKYEYIYVLYLFSLTLKLAPLEKILLSLSL